jgi:hypothetical protein
MNDRKDEAPNFKHGMFESTENFSHKEKLRVIEQAEDYIERLGGDISKSEEFDCYYLAQLEYRIARAENIMWDNVEEYLNKQSPESNLGNMMKRRQDMRKDLGLLEESPDQKQADASEGFFDSLSNDED